ncbi:DNA repair protein RAD51 homolog 2 isoform X1 [Pelodiscus sinensis]|uniref:DNA repair protein RAD51 homolog 2 isoform X1 n=1 Tax=Pelodiscus sinensis TaxID=13735 RepID=UPI003F6D99BF
MNNRDQDNASKSEDSNLARLPVNSRASNRFDGSVEGLRATPLSGASHNQVALFHHRLRPYQHCWSLIFTDRWVNDIVVSGYAIPFNSIPPHFPPSPSLFRDPSHESLLQQEVSRLLTIGAVERVPIQFRGRGFYSTYFLTQKKSGGWRPILDLRRLNHYLRKQKFKMVTLASIIPALHKGDWFASLDLQDAYFHITIHPAHRRFLRFVVGAEHYQYRVLPFGLSAAPRVFSKTLAVVAAYLRRLNIAIFPYLDDCLLKAPTREEATWAVTTTTAVFEALGLIINVGKSSLVPSQDLEFIGARLDALSARVYLPATRFQMIRDLVRTVSIAPRSSILTYLKLLGHMAATTYVVAHARLHLRSLQHWLFKVYTPGVHAVSKTVSIPRQVRTSLIWWDNPQNLLSGVPFHAQRPTVQITTDASLIGWGAHLQQHRVQGLWSAQESLLHINLLELRAVSNACRHFLQRIRGHAVHILTDNICTVYYINRQGGARSRSLCAEAIRLWNWAIHHNITLTASYLQGKDNTIADALSRHFLPQHEWELHNEVAHGLFRLWGFPSIDLFATRHNKKCHHYCSRAGTGKNSLGDALLLNWGSHQLLYAFPHLPLIPRALEKIATEGATVIFIAPFWPRQTWLTQLSRMSVAQPQRLPLMPNLLSQQHGSMLHPSIDRMHLTAWLLTGFSHRK